MTTYSMPNLSSLELMLEKIQQLENEPKDVPPPLPVRPVSKARLPSRARRLLPNDFHSREASVVSIIQQRPAEEQVQIDELDDTREGKLQRVLLLQRCYRGFQERRHFNELKSTVFSLQSFIRGENARNAYWELVDRNKSSFELLKQKKQHLQTDGFEHQLIKCAENKKSLPDEKTCVNEAHDKNGSDTKDHMWIPYSSLVNLQRRVLRTEAAVRNSVAVNTALRDRIKHYEERWMESEARMKSMEKTWQDQLTSIQTSLATVKKGVETKRSSKSRSFEASQLIKLSSNLKFLESPHEAELQATSMDHMTNEHNIVFDECGGSFCRVKSGHWNLNVDAGAEVQKLEDKFNAWKKEYKVRLEEAKATKTRPAHSTTEKSGKRWWRRRR